MNVKAVVTTRSFVYNSAGELTGMTEKSPSGKVAYSYKYDQTGNRTKMIKKGAGQDETVVYLYDSAGRLKSETSSVTGKISYTYDKDGNRTSKQEGGVKTTYTYTVEDRLKAVRSGGRLLMAASYDGDGNRVLEISLRTAAPGGGEAGEAPGVGGKAVQPPAQEPAVVNGEEIKKKAVPKSQASGDSGGNGGGSGDGGGTGGGPSGFRNIFLYGFLSYLRALFMPFTPEDAVTDSAPAVDQYWYQETVAAGLSKQDVKAVQNMGLKTEEKDAILSERIPDVYTGDVSADTYELTRFVNDTNRANAEVLAEYAGSKTLKADYTYGIGRLSMSNAAAAGIAGQTGSATYIQNGRGSVIALVANGNKALAGYTYGPFGETEASVQGGAQGPASQLSFYGYNGENYNPQTGLQYLRARYYDPGNGRFTAADTVPGQLTDPLTWNLYSYAGNNPVNFSDPSGHYSSKPGPSSSPWVMVPNVTYPSHIPKAPYEKAQDTAEILKGKEKQARDAQQNNQATQANAPPSANLTVIQNNANCNGDETDIKEIVQPVTYTRAAVSMIAQNRVGSSDWTGKNRCAEFVNDVFASAGKPIPEILTNYNGDKPPDDYVYSSKSWAPSFQSFNGEGGFEFKALSTGYKPKTGDIIVYPAHVNIIVISYTDGTYATVGAGEGTSHDVYGHPTSFGVVFRDPGGGGFGTIIGYVTY